MGKVITWFVMKAHDLEWSWKAWGAFPRNDFRDECQMKRKWERKINSICSAKNGAC